MGRHDEWLSQKYQYLVSLLSDYMGNCEEKGSQIEHLRSLNNVSIQPYIILCVKASMLLSCFWKTLLAFMKAKMKDQYFLCTRPVQMTV